MLYREYVNIYNDDKWILSPIDNNYKLHNKFNISFPYYFKQIFMSYIYYNKYDHESLIKYHYICYRV